MGLKSTSASPPPLVVRHIVAGVVGVAAQNVAVAHTARRQIFDQDSIAYIKDMRVNQTNTLLAKVDVEKIGRACETSTGATKRKRAEPSKQTRGQEMFPALGSPVKSMPVEWVKQTSNIINDIFTGEMAAVPETKKVKNKTKMQVLSKSTTNSAVNNLNFQEEKVQLLADIKRWRTVADERGQMLDDMEWEIGRLKRELEDVYDRCQ